MRVNDIQILAVSPRVLVPSPHNHSHIKWDREIHMANMVSAEELAPKGYEQISAPAAATSLTPPQGAIYAYIQAVGQNIRWRDDGTDPTAAVGMQVVAGDVLTYRGNLNTFRLIEESAGAEVNVAYYGLH